MKSVEDIEADITQLNLAEVASLLQKLGFQEARQRGSHKQYRQPDGRHTTVPFHPGRNISPILLKPIA